MSNNINALVDVLKARIQQGTELDSDVVAKELGTVGVELLRQLLLDINRCADALEWLARTTAECP